MPVTDRHAFLQEAKPPDQFRSIPTVVLSVFAHSLDIQRSHPHYAGGFLIKPESFDDMKELTRVITACWKGTVTLPTVGDSGR